MYSVHTGVVDISLQPPILGYLKVGSWHWERGNRCLCKAFFLVQSPGLISSSLLSKQGSSSLINWILLKVKNCPNACYYFCCFTQNFLQTELQRKPCPREGVCVIYISIPAWCSLFVCRKGRRNMILSGQKFLPIADPWCSMAGKWGWLLHHPVISLGLNNVRNAWTIFCYFVWTFFFVGRGLLGRIPW